ncbi:MAG: 3-isopropylmalate dehydratase [Gammaproteobacteria bacterium]|nr:3-isopropylmalate dehydratase [Gammaproteobacteria bacterium]
MSVNSVALTTTGRCWCFGDNVNTDVLAPGQYIKLSIEELSSHCLESIDPDFASGVQSGDIIVAGKNFGTGSSREQAAQALLQLGIRGVVAQSFGGIFFRNAINLGLPVMSPLPTEAALPAEAREAMMLDVSSACLTDTSSKEQWQLHPLPEFLQAMLNAGGLVPVLKRRFNAESGA